MTRVPRSRDPGAAGRRAQIAHRLRRLDVISDASDVISDVSDVISDVLQERVPVTRVLATHRHLLAEEAI